MTISVPLLPLLLGILALMLLSAAAGRASVRFFPGPLPLPPGFYAAWQKVQKHLEPYKRLRYWLGLETINERIERLQNKFASYLKNGRAKKTDRLSRTLWEITDRRDEIEFAANWWGLQIEAAVSPDCLSAFKRLLQLAIVCHWKTWYRGDDEYRLVTEYGSAKDPLASVLRAAQALAGSSLLPQNTVMTLSSRDGVFIKAGEGRRFELVMPKGAKLSKEPKTIPEV